MIKDARYILGYSSLLRATGFPMAWAGISASLGSLQVNWQELQWNRIEMDSEMHTQLVWVNEEMESLIHFIKKGELFKLDERMVENIYMWTWGNQFSRGVY